MLDARIDPAAARESDLLAFEIGIEQGRPGAVMCAYNQVNGIYSCENDWLLNQVLKGDWRYPGFVMSDWGAVHSTVRSALAGLDQESGEQLDTRNFFDRLGPAIADGEVPQARLDDMARRILTSIFACGLAERSLGVGPRRPPPERRDGAQRSSGKARSCCATRACCRSPRMCDASSSSARMPTAACPPGAGLRRSFRAAASL